MEAWQVKDLFPLDSGGGRHSCSALPGHGAHIWGVFQPQVVVGWAQTDAALTYSLLLGVLTFGSMVGGKIQVRLSRR